MIIGLSEVITAFLILSMRPILSLDILFLFTEIDPILLKYQPNTGIFNNSYLSMNY